MGFLYQIGIHLFILGMRTASLFNQKIKNGIQGRKNWRNLLDDIPKDANVIWFHCASLGEFDQGLTGSINIGGGFDSERACTSEGILVCGGTGSLILTTIHISEER